MFYPTLTNYSLSMFGCTNIDGTLYLSYELQEKCFSGTHMLWIFTMGIPFTLIWVIGIPLCYFLIMWWHRKDLDNSKTVPYYGFFYKGLKPRFYYWEIVESITKLLFILSEKFIYNQLNLQLIVVVLLVSTKASFIQYFKPYRREQHNTVAIAASYAAYMSLFFGLFFTEDQSEGIRYALILLVLIPNVVFLLYWCWEFWLAMREKFHGYVTTIRKVQSSTRRSINATGGDRTSVVKQVSFILSAAMKAGEDDKSESDQDGPKKVEKENEVVEE